ncbi:MAG: hypothetical protein ACI85I_000281 [Arenicella sp.]|jgi:hypothetical protein
MKIMHINIRLLFSVILLICECGGQKELENSEKKTKMR